MMPNPAFVVEGHMEQKFLQKVCDGLPIRRLECNGDKVAISAIADRVSLISKFLKNYSPIVVIFDRERRDESSASIASALLDELTVRGHNPATFVIGVPDRTIENWILADGLMLASDYKLKVPVTVGDGCFGKNEMKQLFNQSNSYSETTDGPLMLKRVSCSRAQKKSPSLLAFLQAIQASGVQCWWLDA